MNTGHPQDIYPEQAGRGTEAGSVSASAESALPAAPDRPRIGKVQVEIVLAEGENVHRALRSQSRFDLEGGDPLIGGLATSKRRRELHKQLPVEPAAESNNVDAAALLTELELGFSS